MARAPGIVSIRQYNQQSRPQGRARPKAPLVEQPLGEAHNLMGDLGQGLQAVGDYYEHKENVDLAVERIRHARDEDDARAYSAAALADATARYAQRAREIEAESQDGWRGLTANSDAAFNEINAEIIGAAPTEVSRNFVSQHLGILRAQSIARQAERENDLRRSWRRDTIEASATEWERILVTDPSQWARAHATLTQTIGSMTDITADDRRDMTARAAGRMAYFAVAGMVEADPQAALRMLRGGVVDGDAATIGPQIASMFNATMTSGRRTAERNAEVGGAANSLHLSGRAADISVPPQYQGMESAAIEADARQRLEAQFPGMRFTEVIFEGDHLHVGWEGGGEAQRQEGPVAHLTAEDHLRLINAAQAEVNRRDSEQRATARDILNAQTQLLQRDIIPSEPLDPALVQSLFGVDVAQAYLANLASATASNQLSNLSMADVAQVAASAVSPDRSDTDNLLTHEYREAAERNLQSRREDPGGFLLNNRRMRHPDFMGNLGEAVRSGDWTAMQGVFRDRGADAVEARASGAVERAAPLSQPEARALRSWLDGRTAQERLAFFSQASAAMNREAYTAMMTQIAPDGGEVLAFAGFAYGAPIGGRFDGPTVARRLLEGAELLQGRDSASGEDRQRRGSVTLPSVEDMRQEWRRQVGRHAYAGMPADVEERAFGAFRAYYASLARERGLTNTTVSIALVREAAAVASGGTTNWSGRETLLPWGMQEREFEAGVRAAFDQTPALRGRNPRSFDLTAVGNGAYAVEGMRHPNGSPVQIFIRPNNRKTSPNSTVAPPRGN